MKQKSIFISYRRDDTAFAAEHIYNVLVDEFGKESIFKDVDDIPYGVNFKRYLDKTVSECNVLLVLIGEKWLNVANEGEKRRLDDPRDFVRIEIECALNRDISIIPLLIGGVSIPDGNDLPESLQDLSYYNGTVIRRPPDLNADVNRLVRGLRNTLEKSGTSVVIGSPAKSNVVSEAATKTVSSFKYLREAAYTCNKVTNTVKEYQHIETGMEFVLLPGGRFMMGSPDSDDEAHDSERPQHDVTISSFFIAKYTVTQGVWRKIMKTEPWKGEKYVKEGDNYPAVYISWDDAKEFCNKVGLNLPTEAQWEYACRNGTKTKYYWGDKPDDKYMWYDENALDIGEKYAHEVGQKTPNAFGLYDMSGNVWEWCEDTWHDNYKNAPTDGSAWVDNTDSYCVERGGGFGYIASFTRSALRLRLRRGSRVSHLGFRLASSSNP